MNNNVKQPHKLFDLTSRVSFLYRTLPPPIVHHIAYLPLMFASFLFIFLRKKYLKKNVKVNRDHLLNYGNGN